MTDRHTSLSTLRDQIDDIDTAMMNLIRQRTELIERMTSLKIPHQIALRPNREAVILRRLINTNTGNLSKNILIRIWRELISGLTDLQESVTIAVYAPSENHGFWDLARDYYGSSTKMITLDKHEEVIQAVMEKKTMIGILPYPDQASLHDHNPPWWQILSHTNQESPQVNPQVITRLPFYDPGNARGYDHDAVAIAWIMPEPSDDDHSLLRIKTSPGVAQPDLINLLKQQTWIPSTMVRWHSLEPNETIVDLIDVHGFVTHTDPRFDLLKITLDNVLLELDVIGNYPVTNVMKIIQTQKKP